MFSRKKVDPFFDALVKISVNVQEALHFANDFRIKNFEDLQEISTKMKKYETDGDTLIHELIVMLNKSFMTPIEREDILALANSMDDVLDGMEECIAHFDMFALTDIDESMNTFIEYIVKSTDEIVKAMEKLQNKNLTSMRENAILIKDYESKCDEVLRVSIKQLFLHEKDPIRIIQFKDIYEQLEDIADECQKVANTMETIIMRNA
ncbi:DUF47 domain-containing protein [Rummeliibacillus sp. G93]|uniref:Uncharacterized protein n=1 Tax=Rummeliibacillus stabekisii TaxID=241244 RepID=A0A143HA25_9BACL|nr:MULTISPECIES: DUF47 domain-containing protein [Rummeliibacillus]AMW98240.1 hypothetical protein ATY39_01690 [Rummeliibacillus stabekisii]MBB5170073.1 hypothetical protein [Rummeliibacillus stabekisii]MCM3315626.1 DUF47 domain-containing protein [Rummeliibacillus stabekisii]UQW98131.1 DUF47 domain-containing protein [Rummeliibacillus sp. G93]GEL04332.1 hypothetical protein RST01_09590 [Rummeliibacillus stabekisii]